MDITDVLDLIGQPPRYVLTDSEAAVFTAATRRGLTIDRVYAKAVELMLDVMVRDPRRALFDWMRGTGTLATTTAPPAAPAPQSQTASFT